MRADRQSLRASLPEETRALLDATVHVATRQAAALWLVGGAVRDLILDRPLRDLDLATDGDPQALAEAVVTTHGGRVRRWPRFGTAAIEHGPRRLDIAALRTEGYPRPAALPVVRFGASIEQDLARRDFTVNAMALCLAGPRAGALLDPWSGRDDLAERRLRLLHDRSIRDDPTRLWRAARFATRLRLRPDAHSEELMRAGAEGTERLSPRRLWAEFARVAAEPRAPAALRLLDSLGVLRALRPPVSFEGATARALRGSRGPVEAAVLLAVLLAPLHAREHAAGRLGAPRAARAAVDGAARLLALSAGSPEALARAEGTSEAARVAARWLDRQDQPGLQRALRRWQRTRSPLDAAALERIGVERGPALGAWLRRLRRERFLGTLSSAAEARRLVRRERARDSSGGSGDAANGR